jgi:hypothetical protein
MTDTIASYAITRNKVIVDFGAMYCDTPEKILKSDLFAEIVALFIKRSSSRLTPTYSFLRETLNCGGATPGVIGGVTPGVIGGATPGVNGGATPGVIGADYDVTACTIKLLRLLYNYNCDEIPSMSENFRCVVSNKEQLDNLIEELYNFWRHFERFMFIEAPSRSKYTKSSLHHAQFIKANEEFRNLILHVYRHIRENLLSAYPRVYRQLPAGANMGMLLEKIEWQSPSLYERLKDIPFIRLTLIEPPLIIYPAVNKRKGSFDEIHEITPDMLALTSSEWFCFPAKIGPLLAFIYFHRDFISMGVSLCNLFEIADYEDIDAKSPEIILLFGIKDAGLPSNTVFYEDKENNLLVGLLRHTEEIDYFGYFKKMPLTLHNIAMINKGRMPVHGAMFHVTLMDGREAAVVIIGDSGTGKSETIEAMRFLAEQYIRELVIIFDDMGSLDFNAQGRLVGYGTETGAFVRLDDLQPGYPYVEIDRSIFMNPDKTNARLIMPVTQYNRIVRGCPVDIVLYANNHEDVDEKRPAVEFFNNPEDAIETFREGARLAKGTTDERGLVRTYFANPFGAPQRREAHEKIAVGLFKRMFETGVAVGQIRTRLGIAGFEQTGPQTASKQLLEVIRGK